MRPFRSVLYTPGANARALARARELDADALILDLEDAVAVLSLIHIPSPRDIS
ncbi:aldolase/citrate lyase family protein, partial [Bordetella pertussis]